VAKAYLGKISALVTANTSDFNSKLNASAKEVRGFAASMQSTLSRAQTSATASLRGIYTESQKVSRALQAVATQRLSFKGFDGAAVGSIREAVDQFRALQAASVAVNEPLSNAARTVERLSASVQQSFDPALKSAQKSAEYLDAALKRGGIVGEQSFERIRQKALAAAEAANRLAEASQLASVGPRGRELAFAAPRVRDALAASADVRQRAANAPAVALEGGRVSSDVQKLVALDNLIQKRRAEIESGTILNIDTTQARASLENLLAVAKRVREQVNSAIGGGPDAETATLINRARGQREFYEESDRLAKQAAADEVALIARRTNAQRESSEERTRLERQAAADEVALIARRTNAQREGYEERTRLERQAAEDAATLLIRQARAQQEFEEERRRRDAVAASDAANEVAPAINRSRVQRESAIDFGLDLDAPQRQIEVLRGSIVSLKGQLDTLPAGVRTQFIPAIIAAQQNLERLSSLPAATTAELSQAAREVDRLTQALGRARQAANIPSFRRFAADLSTRAAIGELQALQQILARIGAQAGGPAAQAYDRYAAALRRATREGTTQLPETRRELERLQIAAARAAAETGRISFRGALREIRRGGDIARGGFDNFSLALNQAAFAIDDFFSSTGGLEFKLRAISNNITQLAFILGGTQGLFIGLAAVIGGQLAVAITRFVNEGRTAEDQTKALNEALSRQKSLVEELAQAFRSLGDSLTRDAFSPAAQKANEFRKELDEIIKKQKELREARVADVDPTVQRERANQGSLQRRLESETNIGRRVAIQQQLEESRRREREAAAAAVSRQAPSGRQAQDAIEQAGQALFANRTRGEEVVTARDTAVLDEARARAGAAAAAQSPAAIRDLLARQRDALLQSGAAESDTGVANAIARLEELIAALEAPVRRANDALVIAVLEGAKKVSDALAAAQSSIANADFGPSRIGAQADAAARQLESLAKQLETATDEKAIQALKAQQAALLEQSTALRSAATSVEQFASVLDRLAGDLARTVLGEAESAATDAGRRENAVLGAGRATGFNRTPGSLPGASEGQVGGVALDEFRRRETVEAQAAGDRRRAERAARSIRDRAAQLDEQRTRAIREFERQPGGAARDLAAQRDRQQTILDSQTATAEEKQAAQSAIKAINRKIVAAFEQTDVARALAGLADEIDIASQEFAERARQVQQVRESAARGRESFLTPQKRRTREIEGQLNDAQNAVLEDLGEPLKSAAANLGNKPAFDEINKALEDGVLSLEELSGIFKKFPDVKAQLDGDLESAKKNLETMRDNFMENSIAGQMARSVRNAVLAGPSRAALNASDVTTSQGQQELNRLLRGDDPAREADLVEMQKQTGELSQINKGIKDLVNKIGVAQ